LKGNQLDTSDIITSKTPFTLQIDDFRIEYNPDGSPAQYYSDATVKENGYFKVRRSISVNHPLQYKDIKFYQQDYGYLVKAKYTNDEGHEIEDLMPEESTLVIPGTKRVIGVLQYAPNFNPDQGLNQTSGKPVNPRIIFSVSENNKLLGIGAAKFNEKIAIDNNTSVNFTGVEPYTVLKVKSDPGLPLVLAGGIMFIGGLVLALLSRPVNVKPKEIITG
jgi:cytochrome c biogenesis protein